MRVIIAAALFAVSPLMAQEVCRDSAYPPAAGDADCPKELEEVFCGCTGPMRWDPVEDSRPLYYVIERCTPGSGSRCLVPSERLGPGWREVGRTQETWWHPSYDAPLPRTPTLYRYRIWAMVYENFEPIYAENPSNYISYRALPLVCHDGQGREVQCYTGDRVGSKAME